MLHSVRLSPAQQTNKLLRSFLQLLKHGQRQKALDRRKKVARVRTASISEQQARRHHLCLAARPVKTTMIVTCGDCSRKLKIPDSAAGKKIKCPGCQSVIRVPGDGSTPAPPAKPSSAPRKKPASSAPSKPSARKKPATSESADRARSAAKKKRPARRRRPEPNPFDDELIEDYDNFADEDFGDNPFASPSVSSGGGRRKKKRGRNAEGLSTVGMGLLVQAFGMTAILVMLAVFVVCTLSNIAGLIVLAGFAVLAVAVLGGLAMLIGELLCLAAPADSGAKGLIIGAVACHIVSVLVQIANSPQVGGGNVAMAAIGGLAGLAFFVLWLLFLRNIANYAGHSDLAGRVTILLIGIPVCWVIVVGSMVLAFANGGFGAFGAIFGLLMFAVGIAMLVFFVMYLSLLFKLGSQLRK